MPKQRKQPYDWEIEREVVEEVIANDEFVGAALDELFEWMERSDREKAAQAQLDEIPMNPEFDEPIKSEATTNDESEN